MARTLSERYRLTIPLLSMLIVASSGCSSLWPGKSDESDDEARLKKLLTVPDPPELVREAAISHGLRPVRVEGVAVVNGLPSTGGPVDPSMYRDQLLEEMRRYEVKNPNRFLERKETALVRVQGVILPGSRRGDSLDLKITTPAGSQVTNLHGGWLLETRLRHQQVLNQELRKSDVMAIGTGSVLTRANWKPAVDEMLKIEGKVLGGGVVQTDRTLGLVLRPEYQHVKMSANLANAINDRLFFFDGTTRRGIAKAIEDDYIQLDVHPRYRGNEHRMMKVVRAIGLPSKGSDRQSRLAELGERLKEPATAADAALQLEALGDSAIPTLIEGLTSSNPELRFYAAEALAYLDRTEAIEPLEEAAREVPAFRQPALSALQGLEQHLSVEALRRLMDEQSLETRYGAFCAIRRRPDARLELAGETIGNALKLHRIASPASPAVVVSLQETPEIVLFGKMGPIEIPDFLFGPDGLMIKPDPKHAGKLRISRFRPGQPDQRALVAATVEGMIRGIATVDGGYGDIITMLRKTKSKGYMTDQLAINPLPDPVRTYYRDDDSDDANDEESSGDSSEESDEGAEEDERGEKSDIDPAAPPQSLGV